MFQTIGASFSLKQWGQYNVAIWVRTLIPLHTRFRYILCYRTPSGDLELENHCKSNKKRGEIGKDSCLKNA